MVEALTYDEQLLKLKDISDKKNEAFKFYDAEIEAEIEEGFDIHPDLIEKLEQAEKELHEAVFNYNTMLAYCFKNNIETPLYWEKIGFTTP